MHQYGSGDVREQLEAALDRLLTEDRILFEVNINERTLTHRLAIYLEGRFAGFDVDCEYNRDLDAKKQIPRYPQCTDTSDLSARTVFPDIIVHRRGTDENLLVIEVKKSSNDAGSEHDLYKLGRYTASRDDHGLGYRFGAFVVLNVWPDEPGFEIKRLCES